MTKFVNNTRFWCVSQNRDIRNRFVYNIGIESIYETKVRISASTPKLSAHCGTPERHGCPPWQRESYKNDKILLDIIQKKGGGDAE